MTKTFPGGGRKNTTKKHAGPHQSRKKEGTSVKQEEENHLSKEARLFEKGTFPLIMGEKNLHNISLKKKKKGGGGGGFRRSRGRVRNHGRLLYSVPLKKVNLKLGGKKTEQVYTFMRR